MIGELTKLYDAYVDMYRGADGKLPAMMQLKRTHTAFVVKNAGLIADGEGFSDEEREVALAAALLHDTGRYEQLKRYDTFKDSDSVDHAVFSHDIVKEKGWLDMVDRVDSATSGEDAASPLADAKRGEAASSPLVSEAQKEVILKAVLYHNRRELPPEIEQSNSPNSRTLLGAAAHTVRDADKLDIFRVLEDQVAHTDWRKDSQAFWNLKVEAPPSAAVIECIERGRPVDYQHIKVLADFVIIQVGWMMSELRYLTSRRLCRERGHLRYRRDFLHQLTDDPSVDRVCDLTEKSLNMV